MPRFTLSWTFVALLPKSRARSGQALVDAHVQPPLACTTGGRA